MRPASLVADFTVGSFAARVKRIDAAFLKWSIASKSSSFASLSSASAPVSSTSPSSRCSSSFMSLLRREP
ncbi:MAG: hypothetical protein M5U28_17470 [Sandaracinaceae bacterium]|nr:hypothetical protein [Sandaracinaceae bacterium]